VAQESSGASGNPWLNQSHRVNYYQVLELEPDCSSADIRRAYWQKSKLYHPDTTNLAADVATTKFQQLNEAYATLNRPEQRLKYDQLLQRQAQGTAATPKSYARKPQGVSNSSYLDPGERPLSSGEVFALFLLALTFVICLLVAVLVGWNRGELALKNLAQPAPQSSPPLGVTSPGTTASPRPSNLKSLLSRQSATAPVLIRPKPTLPPIPRSLPTPSIPSFSSRLHP
jgi:curved DNA-binding protein CbpA